MVFFGFSNLLCWNLLVPINTSPVFQKCFANCDFLDRHYSFSRNGPFLLGLYNSCYIWACSFRNWSRNGCWSQNPDSQYWNYPVSKQSDSIRSLLSSDRTAVGLLSWNDSSQTPAQNGIPAPALLSYPVWAVRSVSHYSRPDWWFRSLPSRSRSRSSPLIGWLAIVWPPAETWTWSLSWL